MGITVVLGSIKKIIDKEMTQNTGSSELPRRAVLTNARTRLGQSQRVYAVAKWALGSTYKPICVTFEPK